mmetsp:Transcript_37145/g.112143  ORF Transcript_37145/g.112143 Transcript_37145/m.112143 type:complete len:230 (-) Transcript_37145:6-695(-)
MHVWEVPDVHIAVSAEVLLRVEVEFCPAAAARRFTQMRHLWRRELPDRQGLPEVIEDGAPGLHPPQRHALRGQLLQLRQEVGSPELRAQGLEPAPGAVRAELQEVLFHLLSRLGQDGLLAFIHSCLCCARIAQQLLLGRRVVRFGREVPCLQALLPDSFQAGLLAALVCRGLRFRAHIGLRRCTAAPHELPPCRPGAGSRHGAPLGTRQALRSCPGRGAGACDGERLEP